MELARRQLSSSGFLVTLDPCRRVGQKWLARFLIGCDRGRYVRDRQGYEGLARAQFSDVEGFLREDLLHVPYAHLVLRCGLGRG